MKLRFNLKGLSITLLKDYAEHHVSNKISVSRWFILLYVAIGFIGVFAWIYYFNNNLTLSYNDARSHLNISRRVVDSLQPGFAQIGSVWLPLQHLLQLPLIWIDPLFRTGLAGSIISILSYVGSAYFIIRIAKALNINFLGTLTAIVVFCLNPNLLFLQTTPMTESLMLLTSLGMTYYFVKWVKFQSLSDLIICGLFTFLGMLTRYDGWFLFGFILIAVSVVSVLRRSLKQVESNIIIYATLSFFAVALWLGWNGLIFGDPLYFINGGFSAKAQQDILLAQGRLFTKGNLSLSTYTYVLAIVLNSGLIITILGLLGILKELVTNRTILIRAAVFVLLAPIAFNIVSLFLGQSVIHLPQLPPYTWFNIRYGIMALPFIAIGAALLVNKRTIASILLIIIVLVNYGNMQLNNNIITIEDGVRGSSGYFLDDIGSWMHNNVKENELILVAASSHDALIFISGLPLNQFITEGTGKYWKESLVNPTKHASFIVMHEGDLVYKAINNKPIFTKNYKLVYKGEFSNVYKKNK